jgi:hypothetical protein
MGNKFYFTVHRGIHFSDVCYSAWSETGHALSPQLLNVSLECAIKTIQ